MELHGTYIFDASRDRVWNLLMDPAVVFSCAPGCDRFEPLGNDQYSATLTVSVAMITGRYEGTVTIADKVPPTAFRLIVEGRGSVGFVKGDSHVTLREEGPSTAVDVSAAVEVGGAVARVGQRLLGTVSKMMLDRFFACLQAKVTSPPKSH
jgi:carbon monoxide dehydrogenase subunit G